MTLSRIKIHKGDITKLQVDAVVNAANTSLAFPAISTGIFRFPIERACRIAVDTVLAGLKQ